jgi:flagellin
MSSILTNNGAIAALQTLKGINRQMGAVQTQISTGKKVNSAKDNAAVWAISKAMESDVAGFKKVSDSLSLGLATISVARQGAETVTDLLTLVKEKVVAAQEENVDRDKIQTDINALRDQVAAVVGAAQFNGQYMLTNTDQTANSGGINVLASIDRSFDGVTSSDIRVLKQDLGTGSSSIGASLTAMTGANNSITGDGDGAAYVMTGAATAPTGTTTFGTASTDSVAAGTAFSIAISGVAGNGLAATTDRNDISYVARDGDTMADVVAGLAQSFNTYAANDLGTDTTVNASVQNGNEIVFTGHDGTGDNFSLTINQYAADASTTIGGRLSGLADIDVTTQTGVDAALAGIDALIDTAIDSAAAFGSAEMRIESQKDFVSGLTDALKSGIGTLVDADMEETSARLQALQVQQQLGIQAMSIANSAPQSLLGLFR